MGDKKLQHGGGKLLRRRPNSETVHVGLGVGLQPDQHGVGGASIGVEGASCHHVVDGGVHPLQHVDVQPVIDDLAHPADVNGLASLEDLLALEGLDAPVLPLGEEVGWLQLQVLGELRRHDGQSESDVHWLHRSSIQSA